MKTSLAVWMLCAAVAVPVTAGDELELAVISRAIEFHFDRTRPFDRGRYVVAAVTRQKLETDGVPMLTEVIFDPRAVEEMTGSAAPAESRTLDTTVDAGVVDLSKFKTAGQYDWRQIVEAYPEARLLVEASRPIFDSSERYAVIRLDRTRLHGGDAGVSTSILYGLEKGPDLQWQVTQLVAPCCARKQ